MAARSTHDKFVRTLSPEERTVLELRDEVYYGSWDEFLRDLRERLRGRPYIFRLVNRIQDDLQRIEKLQNYERKHRVNLVDFLKVEKEEG